MDASTQPAGDALHSLCCGMVLENLERYAARKERFLVAIIVQTGVPLLRLLSHLSNMEWISSGRWMEKSRIPTKGIQEWESQEPGETELEIAEDLVNESAGCQAFHVLSAAAPRACHQSIGSPARHAQAQGLGQGCTAC